MSSVSPNALLVRYGPEGRLVWVVDTDAVTAAGMRIESFYENGKAKSRADAIADALHELTRLSGNATEITVGVDPTGDGDVPGRHVLLGDWVTVDGAERRMVANGGTWSGEKRRKTYAPKLGDRIEPQGRRMRRQLKQMINGTIGGQARGAAPQSQIRPHSVRNPVPPQTYTRLASAAETASGPWSLPYSVKAALLYVDVDEPQDDPFDVDLLVNGSVVDTCTVGASDPFGRKVINVAIPEGAVQRLQCSTLGFLFTATVTYE